MQNDKMNNLFIINFLCFSLDSFARFTFYVYARRPAPLPAAPRAPAPPAAAGAAEAAG